MSTIGGPSTSESDESSFCKSHSLRKSADLPLLNAGCEIILETLRLFYGALVVSNPFDFDGETELFFY